MNNQYSYQIKEDSGNSGQTGNYGGNMSGTGSYQINESGGPSYQNQGTGYNPGYVMPNQAMPSQVTQNNNRGWIVGIIVAIIVGYVLIKVIGVMWYQQEVDKMQQEHQQYEQQMQQWYDNQAQGMKEQGEKVKEASQKPY